MKAVQGVTVVLHRGICSWAGRGVQCCVLPLLTSLLVQCGTHEVLQKGLASTAASHVEMLSSGEHPENEADAFPGQLFAICPHHIWSWCKASVRLSLSALPVCLVLGSSLVAPGFALSLWFERCGKC